jgi:hypothetical protein
MRIYCVCGTALGCAACPLTISQRSFSIGAFAGAETEMMVAIDLLVSDLTALALVMRCGFV